MSSSLAIPHTALPGILAVIGICGIVSAVLIFPPDRDERVQHLLADGNLGAALQLIEADQPAAPVSARARADRVEIYLGLGRIEDARRAIEAELLDNPDSLWALERKNEIIGAVGTLDERIAWANARFARDRRSEDLRYLLGIARLQGDAEREASLIEEALTLDLALTRDVERLGLIRAAQDRREEAVAILERAVFAPGAGQTARLTLFSLMTGLGQTERAVEIALATGLDPADPRSVTLYASQARGIEFEEIRAMIMAAR